MTNEIEQLSCQELVELVTSYLEGALTEAERGELERHLDTCDGCRDYVEQMRATIALAGGARPLGLSAEIEESLLAAFRDWQSR